MVAAALGYMGPRGTIKAVWGRPYDTPRSAGTDAIHPPTCFELRGYKLLSPNPAAYTATFVFRSLIERQLNAFRQG